MNARRALNVVGLVLAMSLCGAAAAEETRMPHVRIAELDIDPAPASPPRSGVAHPFRFASGPCWGRDSSACRAGHDTRKAGGAASHPRPSVPRLPGFRDAAVRAGWRFQSNCWIGWAVEGRMETGRPVLSWMKACGSMPRLW